MIPINAITQWRHSAPWLYQSQIEQDLVLSTEFEKNLLLKMQMQEFLKDTTLVLSDSIGWNPKHGAELVMEKLIDKLPGEPWKLKSEFEF